MKKTHHLGTISDRELNKRVRKELPPPPRKHRSAKDYRRNPKHKNNDKKDLPETWEDKELRANAFLGFGSSF
jgi:hypothetical protein